MINQLLQLKSKLTQLINRKILTYTVSLNLKTIISSFLLVFVFLYGGVYFGKEFHLNYKKALYYQHYFDEPLSNWVCGRGFVKFDTKDPNYQEIRTFFDHKKPSSLYTKSLNCEDIRSVALTNSEARDLIWLRPWMGIHDLIGSSYLIGSIGLLWKVVGISWQNVYLLAALLGGLSCVAINLLFGLLIPVWIGTFLTILISHHSYFPRFVLLLRDFSKAPFFLLALYFLLVFLIKVYNKVHFKKLLIYPLVMGVIVGIGFGFRPDLKVVIPPIVASFLLPLFHWETNRFKSMFLYFLIFFSAFFLVISPILFGIKHHRTYHVINLGMADKFSTFLGLKSKAYSKTVFPKDRVIDHKIQGFNKRENVFDLVRHGSENYDRLGRMYLIQWVKTFPYDFYIRILVSLKRILIEPKVIPKKLTSFWGFWLYLSLFSCFIIAIGLPLYYSLYLSFCIGLIFGFPSLQFGLRHYFHLEPLAIALVLSPFLILRKLRNSWGVHYFITQRKVFLRRGVILISLGIFATRLIPWGLREFQQVQVQNLLKDLQSRPRERVAFKTTKKDQWIFTLHTNKETSEESDYYVLTFDRDFCPKDKMKYKVLWDREMDGINLGFSGIGLIREGVNPQLLFSVDRGPTRFSQVELPGNYDSRCLKHIEKLKSLAGLTILPRFYLFQNIKDINFNFEATR